MTLRSFLRSIFTLFLWMIYVCFLIIEPYVKLNFEIMYQQHVALQHKFCNSIAVLLILNCTVEGHWKVSFLKVYLQDLVVTVLVVQMILQTISLIRAFSTSHIYRYKKNLSVSVTFAFHRTAVLSICLN